MVKTIREKIHFYHWVLLRETSSGNDGGIGTSQLYEWKNAF
jgi:hypothetical protein